MNVAEILSDLTSLRVCEYNDALNLVTVNERLSSPGAVGKNGSTSSTENQPQAAGSKDDLRVAAELVELHYEMKSIHKDGRVDDELLRGREGVDRVLQELA
ncbi:hypothetical protein P175DRAFT_0407171, partial [Aspergillus ochraceoroseus IBT 24754]